MPPNPDLVSPSQPAQAEPQLPLRVIVAVLMFTLVTLACTFLKPVSRSASGRLAVLPTLTRTPLPTLTPTSMATPAAAAVAIPPDEATPVVAPAGPETEAEPSGQVPAPIPASAAADGSEAGQPSGAIDTVSTGEPVSILTEVAPLNTEAQPAAPTDTPTATATTTPLPTSPPTATATEILPTSTPTETSTPTPIPEDWSFAGVRIDPGQYEGSLVLYGNLINNTDLFLEIYSITGTFFDVQGQVKATADDTYAFWPSYVISPGGGMPFKMIVDGIDNADNFDLDTEAEPSDEIPRQDFDFFEVNQWTEDESYCIEGKLGNPAGELDEYLIIVLILYDPQDRVINFSDYQEFGSSAGKDGESFKICVDPPNQEVARYELLAWGL